MDKSEFLTTSRHGNKLSFLPFLSFPFLSFPLLPPPFFPTTIKPQQHKQTKARSEENSHSLKKKKKT